MTEKSDSQYWSEEVHADYHPPEGTFTHKAPEVVKTLLKGADNNPTTALRRLLFYMNRAGEKLSNREELDAAKSKLENLIKQKDKMEKKDAQ